MMTATTLLTKYRPMAFNEVMGNEPAIKALERTCQEPDPPHTFLFTGPSGVGKTTLARIVATVLGSSISEIDAASNSGVDAMRQVVEATAYTPIGSESVMIIIDECHTLSKSAWQTLLKTLEDTPKQYYFSLCTTEPSKIPDAIRTRSFHTNLKTLRKNEIEDLVLCIAELEQWVLTGEIISGIVQAATGQPRKALSILQSGHGAQSREELAAIVAEVEKDSSPLTELLRYMLQGGRDWGKISKLLAAATEDDDDGLLQASRYVSTVIVGSEEQAAQKNWKLLDSLTFPRTGYDKKSILIASVCAYLWN